MAIAVHAATKADREWLARTLLDHGWLDVARRGELVHPLEHPSLVATMDGRAAGILTYVVTADACEILVLLAAEPGHGVGSALIDAVDALARERGWTSLWVVTTNDNVDALRFYQRRGFVLRALRPGAVDAARRTLKPAIPVRGSHGIPRHDEIELWRTI